MFFNVLFNSTFITYNLNGAVAQLARAPALQAGGQEFDSPQLHQTDKTIKSQLKSQRKHIEKYIDEIRKTREIASSRKF